MTTARFLKNFGNFGVRLVTNFVEANTPNTKHKKISLSHELCMKL